MNKKYRIFTIETNVYRIINIILYFSLFCALGALILCLYCGQPKFKYKKFNLEKWTVEDYIIQEGDTYQTIAESHCYCGVSIDEYIYNIQLINGNKPLIAGEHIILYKLRHIDE